MEKAALVVKEKIYTFDGTKLENCDVATAKRSVVGAPLSSTLLIPLSFKFPLSTPEDQLPLQVELKMYNEGGLDPNKEYKIDYILYRNENEGSYLVEAFAIEQEILEQEFGAVAKEIGFIDVLFPRFIAYKSLYTQEVTTNDLFLYIAEDEAFAAIYQKGRFIGYRRIDSLTQIAKRSGIELAKVKSFLSQKGLILSNYSPDETHIFDLLSDILYKNIEKVVYAINFKRSHFGLESIDRVVLDFGGKEIPGLKELFEGFGYEPIALEVFECCGKREEASLLVLANYVLHFQQLDQRLNFTIFERKKPLYTYRTVQIAAAFVGFLLLLGGVYGYLEYERMGVNQLVAQKEAQLERTKRRAAAYLAQLKKLKSQKKALLKRVEELQNRVEVYQETLDMIPFIQEAKIDRERMINDIVEGLYHFRLSSKAIEQNSSKWAVVNLVSNSDERQKIAGFMEYLYVKNYPNVSTRSIRSEKGIYESSVRIER